MNTQEDHQKQLSPLHFWNALHQIQHVLGIETGSIAEMMSLTESDFLKMKTSGEEPKVTSTMGLTRSLNIGFDTLMCGDIDYKALARQYYGKVDALPEKYAIGAFSRRRLAITVLDFVESRFGLARRALLLRRFQMNEAMLSNPDAEINLCLGGDMIDFLFKVHQDEEMISEIGEYSIVSNQDSPVAKHFSGATSPSEVYEMAVDATSQYFEKNYQWRLKSMKRHGCVIAGKPNPELEGLFEKKYRMNPVACILRKGYFMSFPTYAGFQPSFAFKTACVCAGDPECVLEIQFRQPSSDSDYLATHPAAQG